MRAGRVVTVCCRGEPVAEIRSVGPRRATLDERLKELERRGALVREYSLERLFRLLTALGRDIDIVIRPPRSAAGEKLRIAAAEPA